MPEISIVVPIYKIERTYLEKSVAILIHQTFQDIEILLIDDGSPDECGKICDELAKKDARIRVIHQENQGVSVARNAGVEAGKGKYIIFLDPDDWLELDFCEVLYRKIEETQADVVFCQKCHDYADETPPLYFNQRPSFVLTDDDCRRVALCLLKDDVRAFKNIGDIGACWGKIIRRDLLIDNHIVFPAGVKKAQDYVWNLYVCEYAQKYVYDNYLGYHYLSDNPTSICHRSNKEISQIILSVLRQMDLFVEKMHPSDTAYVHALGAGCFNMIRVIESSYLYHSDVNMSYKQIKAVYKEYLNDPVVKKYSCQCCQKDFNGIKGKVRYLLLKHKMYFAYYMVCKAKGAIG